LGGLAPDENPLVQRSLRDLTSGWILLLLYFGGKAMVRPFRFAAGRFGAGWLKTEHDQAGIPFDPPGVRVDRMEEALGVIKALWTGEPGRHNAGPALCAKGAVSRPGR
jgi:hypothetical protein